mmetsp:Transcript_96321/g.220846  ORF Transcript_96321/g.220846 Transcript_96321/m.220846 type:complete len:246 (-) Transcript_96321:523-1260(-)
MRRWSLILAAAAAEFCQDAEEEDVALLQLRGFRPHAQEEKAADPEARAPCPNSTIFDEETASCLTLTQYSQRHRETGSCPSEDCLRTAGCYLDKDKKCRACDALETAEKCNSANLEVTKAGANCVWNDGLCAAGATVVLGLPPEAKGLGKDFADQSLGVQYRPFAVKPIRQGQKGDEWEECTDEKRCPGSMDFAVFTWTGGRSVGGFWRTGQGTDTCERHFDYQWPFVLSGEWQSPALRLSKKKV